MILYWELEDLQLMYSGMVLSVKGVTSEGKEIDIKSVKIILGQPPRDKVPPFMM